MNGTVASALVGRQFSAKRRWGKQFALVTAIAAVMVFETSFECHAFVANITQWPYKLTGTVTYFADASGVSPDGNNSFDRHEKLTLDLVYKLKKVTPMLGKTAATYVNSHTDVTATGSRKYANRYETGTGFCEIVETGVYVGEGLVTGGVAGGINSILLYPSFLFTNMTMPRKAVWNFSLPEGIVTMPFTVVDDCNNLTWFDTSDVTVNELTETTFKSLGNVLTITFKQPWHCGTSDGGVDNICRFSGTLTGKCTGNCQK